MNLCPKCSGEALPILYGSPAIESFEMLERGEVVLGGCCVEEGLPTDACRTCGHRWGHLALGRPDDLGSPFDGLDEDEVAGAASRAGKRPAGAQPERGAVRRKS